MQTKYRILSISMLSFFSISSSATTKINFLGAGGDPRAPSSNLVCKYNDILKSKPAAKEGEDPYFRIILNEKTINDPENSEACISSFSNLTNLDQPFVQEKVANILKDIPCKPDVPLTIFEEHTENETTQKIYNLKSPWIVWKISITGCLTDSDGNRIPLPPSCRYPHYASSSQSDVDYDEMIEMLTKCKADIIQKVHDEKLMDQWQADNDPNAKNKMNDKIKHKANN